MLLSNENPSQPLTDFEVCQGLPVKIVIWDLDMDTLSPDPNFSFFFLEGWFCNFFSICLPGIYPWPVYLWLFQHVIQLFFWFFTSLQKEWNYISPRLPHIIATGFGGFHAWAWRMRLEHHLTITVLSFRSPSSPQL